MKILSETTSGIVKYAASASVARAVSIGTGLMSVPIVLGHIGQDNYGIWVLSVALTSLLALGDGGISIGVTTHIARAFGVGDINRIGHLVRLALLGCIVIGALLLTLAALVISIIDWQSFVNLPSDQHAKDLRIILLINCVAYYISFPIAVLRQTRIGMSEGSGTAIWDTWANIAAFAALMVAVHLDCKLVTIATVLVSVPVVVRGIGVVTDLGRKRNLRSHIRRAKENIGAQKPLISSSVAYLIYTLTQTLSVQSDQILISHFLGPNEVATYSITQKLLTQSSVLITVLLAAQWPAYSQAFASGNRTWVRRHLIYSSILFISCIALINSSLAWHFPKILKLWVGGALSPPADLVWAVAANSVLLTAANIVTFFYLAIDQRKWLVQGQLICAFLTVVSAYILIPILGAIGATIAIAIGTTAGIILPGIRNIAIATHEPSK